MFVCENLNHYLPFLMTECDPHPDPHDLWHVLWYSLLTAFRTSFLWKYRKCKFTTLKIVILKLLSKFGGIFFFFTNYNLIEQEWNIHSVVPHILYPEHRKPGHINALCIIPLLLSGPWIRKRTVQNRKLGSHSSTARWRFLWAVRGLFIIRASPFLFPGNNCAESMW